MRNTKAVFKKQFKDTLKNPAQLIQFIIFPLIAFVMSALIVTDFEGVPDDIAEIIAASMPTINMVTMQATVFVGMGLITVIPGIISEDMEKKSLRFLMMAGVKPVSYLLGVSGVLFFVSFFTSIAFSFISEFSGLDFWIFTGAMMSGVAASIILGGMFGILAGNQQAASGLVLPIALILGFGPMIAQFNDTVANILHVSYTQQLNVIADYLTLGGGDTPLWQSFAIMWANVAVLGVLFALIYRKKGLKR
ncbi:MAG: ABC transporter permease [Oscillospiraceae bacterium]|nr:ABC transporter permease [Oscillospiraceae bacterium]